MQGIGLVMIVISAMLYCTRYICVAIYMSEIDAKSYELFHEGFSYIGSQLLITSGAILVVGILLIVYSSIKNKKK